LHVFNVLALALKNENALNISIKIWISSQNINIALYVNLFLFYVPKDKYCENVYFIFLLKNISEEKWMNKFLLVGS